MYSPYLRSYTVFRTLERSLQAENVGDSLADSIRKLPGRLTKQFPHFMLDTINCSGTVEFATPVLHDEPNMHLGPFFVVGGVVIEIDRNTVTNISMYVC
jgi:hypothetical protein